MRTRKKIWFLYSLIPIVIAIVVGLSLIHISLLKRNRVILHNLNSENPENNPSLDKRIEVTDNASYLIGNIGRVIEYYNSKYKDRPIQEIICMGKGCAVAGIHEPVSYTHLGECGKGR